MDEAAVLQERRQRSRRTEHERLFLAAMSALTREFQLALADPEHVIATPHDPDGDQRSLALVVRDILAREHSAYTTVQLVRYLHARSAQGDGQARHIIECMAHGYACHYAAHMDGNGDLQS